MRFPSVLDGYGLDLDLGALGQVLDGEGGAGRALAVKEGGVDLVHGAEVRDVREQHGGLDDALEAETGLGEDGDAVLQALLGLALDILGGDGAGTVKSKGISYTKMVMEELEEILDNNALEKAAELIAGARSLVIVSEGGSGTISRAAYDIFLKLAIPCRCIEDLIFQTMEISMMDKDDLLLIIVNSGRTWNVLQNASYAKERGIKIVGIVVPANSPLAKYLAVEIVTSVFSSDYFSDISAARTCELVTISILHSIIALTRTEEQIDKSHEIGMSIERKRLPPK